MTPSHKPLTMAVADELEAGGFADLAVLAREYAVDRPRWWQRSADWSSWFRGVAFGVAALLSILGLTGHLA